MTKNPTWRLFLFGVLISQLLCLNTSPATAQGLQARRPIYLEFFTYNPTGRANLDCFFEQKSGRLAAVIKQNHSVAESAAGTIVHGVLGRRARDLTLTIDLSNDTIVTDRAWWVLYTIGRNGSRRHIAAAEEFSGGGPSGPDWTTYTYNANDFHPSNTDHTPSIANDDRITHLALSLIGRRNAGPVTHTLHWASNPGAFGQAITEFKTKIKVVRTRGRIWPGDIP